MLGAGAFLVVLGVAGGELGTIDPAGFSLESVAAWLYLAVFGSLIAFTAYAWLLRNAPISKVVTHQYVNPLVAIILGAALLDEQLSLATGLGAALIVGSVFVAVRKEGAKPSASDVLPATRNPFEKTLRSRGCSAAECRAIAPRWSPPTRRA